MGKMVPILSRIPWQKALCKRRIFTSLFLVGTFGLFPPLLPLPTLMATQAAAAEPNKIRLGDDYAILPVPEGRGHHWCQRNCEKDARCRSWTYLRPNALRRGQCRLKHTIAPAFANRCCVSGIKAKAKKAADAPLTLEERCARYARVALEQQDENKARACGFRGPRWHHDYSLHYRWCLNKPARLRNRERLARDSALARCDRHKARLNQSCMRYADRAVAQFKAANTHGCDYRGPRWHGDFNRHYNWCQKVRPLRAEREDDIRKQKISQCLLRGGGRFDQACQVYAETAVEQARTAHKRDCGYRGPRWTRDFAKHYQWCLRVPPYDRQAENTTREHALDRCMLASAGSPQGRMACEHFARVAMAQNTTNKKLACGLTGALWQGSEKHAFRWCLRNSSIARDRQVARRERALSQCIARGGGPFDRTCDVYANKAVQQFVRSQQRGCNFRGRRWHANYLEHYRWCQKARPAERNRQTRQRRRALRLCKVGKALGIGFRRSQD